MAFTASRILVFDEDKIQQSFCLSDIVSIKVVQRSSFKHPFLGSILTLVMLGASAFLLRSIGIDLGSIHGSESAQGIGAFFAGILFVLGLGLYLCYQIVTKKQLYWIELTDTYHVHEIPVTGVTRNDLEDFIRAVSEKIPEMGKK